MSSPASLKQCAMDAMEYRGEVGAGAAAGVENADGGAGKAGEVG